MQLAEIRNFDKVSACSQLGLSALKIKMNSVIAGRLFSVHFSGWFTSTHVAHLLWLLLRKNDHGTIFLNFPQFIVPYQCLFQKMQ